MGKKWISCTRDEGDRGSAGTRMSSGYALFLFLFLVLVTAMPVCGAADETGGKKGWQFMVDLNLWALGIGGETAGGDDIDVPVDDLIDSFELGFSGTFHARNGRWHFSTDLLYLNLAEENNGQIGVPGRPGLKVDAELELETWVVTPAVGYSFIDTGAFRMEVLGGARYLYIKPELDLHITGPLGSRGTNISESADVWDGIVGIRGDVNLTKHWYFPFYADVGTGDSDLTWQAMAGVGYKFCTVDVVAGYRYLEWQFEENKVIDSLDVSGPLVGVRFRF